MSVYKKRSYGTKKRYNHKKTSNFDRRVERIAKRIVEKDLEEELELKYNDREVYNQNIGTGGVMYSLTNQIVAGTAPNQRIGEEIHVKGINLRVRFQANGAAATYETVRVIVFKWNSQGTPTVGQILELTTNVGIRQLSQISMANSSNIQIKMDTTEVVSSVANMDIPYTFTEKYYIKCPGKARWDAAGNSESGQIYMLVISDASLNFAQFSFTSRTRYTSG